MGNGHDTLFMASQVAPDGRVIAFDIQRDAVRTTRERLGKAGLAAVVELHCVGHEHIEDRMPGDWRGKVDAVMFNLGYLPGADKSQITRPETTLAALDQATRLLRPGGLISLMLYRTHRGASKEVADVQRWLGAQSGLSIRRIASPGPWLYLLVREHAGRDVSQPSADDSARSVR
jgi:ubiquinone/menaquinone biosynthesis C-methylase UbiE